MTPVLKVTLRKNSDFTNENNRRAKVRYGIKESFRYRSFEGDGYSEWSSGFTLNMSARGILATFREPLRPGTRVEMHMNWPGVYFDRDLVRLSLTATVIRTDSNGTALRILTHRFQDIKPQAMPTRETRYRTPPARPRRYA
jgi:hypothetical protein